MSRFKIVLGIVIFSLFFMIVADYPDTITLELGVFSGSNWGVPSGESYKIIDGAIERFEKKCPGVKVEYESGIMKSDYSSWLSDKIVKGKQPDVFMVLDDDFNTLSSIGALANLDSYMTHDQKFSENDYYSSVLKAGTYSNNQYALPYECDPTLMFVNKTLLQKCHIDMPDNDWTLEDFYSICKKVSQYSQYYGCYDYGWLDSVYGYDTQVFNEKGTECFIDQSSVKSAIEFYRRLNDLNKGHVVTSEEFDKGLVAFSPLSLSVYRTYKPYPWRVKKYSTFEWDCLKMPTVSKNKGSAQVSTLLMGMSAKSYHKSQAWNLLKELCHDTTTQQSLTQYSQGISPLKEVAQSQTIIGMLDEKGGQVNMSLLNQALLSARNREKFKKYDSAMTLIDTNMSKIIYSSDDFDLSLIELQKAVNKYLNE